MEEHVIKLAELQAELKAETTRADDVCVLMDRCIRIAEDELKELWTERAELRQPFTESIEEMRTTIEDLHKMIIDEWTGEKKTLVFDAGTLKFRTSKKLVVHNDSLMLEDMIDNLPTAGYIMRYIKGFNLTQLKEYMKTYPQQPDVAELAETTTVKLEQKSG